MNANTSPPESLEQVGPLDTFSKCHLGFASQLEAFAELPALLGAAARAREVAQLLAKFGEHMREHHQDEERELFPAVLHSAAPGDEKAYVQGMIDRLTAEHRQVETQWKALDSAVKDAARGKPAELDPAAVEELVLGYLAHARYEERSFLPLAEVVLGRNANDMSALGLSLHMRHAPPVIGYI